MLPMGTADVYPGPSGGPYGGDQPGCGFFASWFSNPMCSHMRAPEMFIATIRDNGLCQASKTCGGEPLTCSQAAGDNVKLGYWMSDQTSGSFAIDTSANFPYCS